MNRTRAVAVGALLVAASVGTALAGPASAATSQVVVPRGQAVQIAFVGDRSTAGAPYYAGIRNAIRMAVQLHPAIAGFPIRVSDDLEAPCDGATAFTQNAADAAAVVADPQNVAVIGHFCSLAFAGTPVPGTCSGLPAGSALSIYEASDIVTINGSTTIPCLSSVGPRVFNATTVPDPGSDVWYAQVTALPIDRLWQFVYRIEFGTAPTPFADLYFDATNLLLTRIAQTARVVGGSLVIDRAALAQAVRHTSHFPGVTCSISLDPATGFRVNDQPTPARCGWPGF